MGLEELNRVIVFRVGRSDLNLLELIGYGRVSIGSKDRISGHCRRGLVVEVETEPDNDRDWALRERKRESVRT